jgi:hypothetical protein
MPELLRFEEAPAGGDVAQQFAQLATRCMALDPEQRPSFDQVNVELDKLRRNIAAAP